MTGIIVFFPVDKKDWCITGFVTGQICIFGAVVLDVTEWRQRFQISALRQTG
jgi:hypothetical protein